MKERNIISVEKRMELMANENVYSVTKYNIYFTAEFKRKAHIELLKGKSILKILSENNIPLDDLIISRANSLKSNILKLGETGNFHRKYSYRDFDLNNIENMDNLDPDTYQYVLQELSFVKKIANLEKKN